MAECGIMAHAGSQGKLRRYQDVKMLKMFVFPFFLTSSLVLTDMTFDGRTKRQRRNEEIT